MKNSNLLNRLLSYSHEKQSPQRFGRYAAMLIMLLTLGVGQMWGYTVYLYTGSFTDWESGADFQIWDGSNNHDMNSLGNHWYSTTLTGSPSAWIKRVKSSNHGEEWNSFSASITSSKNVWYVSDWNSGGELKYYIKHPWDGGSWTWQTMTFNSANTFKYTGIYKSGNGANVNQDKGDSNYLTPSNASNVNDKVPAIWTYTPSSNSLRIDPAYTLTVNAGSNGSASGSQAKGIAMSTKYAISATANTGYHFNNWTRVSGGTCTFDNASSASTNVTVTGDASATVRANFALNTYTVAYNANDAQYPGTATGSTSSSSHTYGTAKALTSNGFSRAGYTFAGWNTEADGSGTSYTNGQSVTNLTSTHGATVTLYAKWTENKSTITLVASPSGKGTFQVGGVTVTSTQAGVTTTPEVTAVPIPGYSFSGWSITGGATISSTTDNPTTVTGKGAGADATLTATFEEDLTYYDVTFGVGTSYTSLGSISATNNSTSSAISSGDDLVSGTSVTFTASPNTGYTVEGWYTNAACTEGKHDEGSTTYTVASLSSAVTVYVKFVEKTWSVAFAAGTGGTVTTPDATPQTVGQLTGISIEATPATGYTFNSWSSSNGGSFTSGASTNSNTFKPTADATVTASFNETMSSLSTSCHYDAGNPSYAAPSVSGSASNVGYATTRTITATAAGTGYTFAGWTLTNCTRTDGGAVTATQITIRSNGDGADVSVVANYNELLTTGWKVIGDNQSGSPFGDNYAYASGKAMSKKTGHATEANAYRTIDVTKLPGSYYGFKVATAAGNSNAWGYGESDGYYITFNRSASGNQKQVYSGNQHELKFVPDALGEYEFRVNYPGNKYVYVTFPTAYTVTFSRGTVDGASGTVTAEYSSVAFSTGTKVQSGKSVTFKAPAAKTGYTFQGWYTVNNGSGSTNRVSTEQNYITTITADKTLYACYTINNHAITHSDATHGSYTIKVGSAAAVSTNTTSDYGKTITLAATPATGYHFGSWSAYKTETPATTVTVTDNKFTMPDYAVTVGATFSPNTYRVQFHRNGASEATVYQNFTYDVAQNLTANTYTRTGYTFGGWATSKERADAGTVDYTDGQNVNNLTSTNNGTYHLYAKWTPKTTTISYSQSGTGYSTGGQSTTKTATYDAAMPTPITTPTAANGWAFMGYYDALEPLGTQYYNADGTSARTWDKEDATATLYAYFKKAEITALALDQVTVDLGASVTATATVSPEPTGATVICWKLLRNNDTEVGDQPTFSPENARIVSFNVPSSSGTYKVVSTLRLDGCEGTILDSDTTNVIVAGVHTVTIQYKCGSDVLQAATSVEATPLDWTDVSAPDIFGYRFTSWTAGDGITLQSSTSTNPNKIKASYGGTLTANYAKNDYIYFKNTLGWANDNIYVYFYKDGGYWDSNDGAGATGDACIGKGKMSLVDGETDILYWDYGAGITGGAAAATKYVAFTWGNGTGEKNFYQRDVVYPLNGNNEGFSSGTPMFVPLAKTVQPNPNYRKNGNQTPYFDRGYWTKYLGGTGYSIDIFYSKGGAYDKTVVFEGDGTHEMPYTATVNLSGGSTLGIKIHRSSGLYYYTSTDITMTNASTAKVLTYDSGSSSQTGIQTNAAGDYVFTLTCPSSGKLNLSVKYPAAANDYRIVYNDRVAWSGSAHSASWTHPSALIHKNTSATDPKTDIVSFYVSKTSNPAASMKFQYISSITNSSITWTDVTDGGINLNDITESGVYNFYLSQPAGGATIQVDSIKPYTGDYYIRSAMANSKWDNYTTDPSHLMNYSDYAEENRGYSHYWVKFVSQYADIRYVIANDYSPCISDTLVSEASQPITIDGEGKMTAPSTGVNIRSMWNQSTNKLSRAFITGPVSNQYLLLRSEYQSTADNNRLFKSWTSPASNVRLNHASFSEGGNSYDLDTLLFIDKENWIYELDIYARPAATYKLSALVNGTTTFIRGAEGNYTTAANVDTVIGGTLSSTTAYHVRMVYDFKTDRMVKAWMPTGTIEDNLPINADIMIVREHQEAGQQITFNGGSLSKVHTVYGVMRFNRWTLNNKSTTGGHSALPVGDQKSNYERGLYWISFPFDVNLSDVFGFGSYGTDWIIMEYDGAARAKEGYWADSKGFWKYVMPSQRANYVLKTGQGYVLALDLDRMKDNNTDFWVNNIEQVELFFPSADEVENISQTTVKTTVQEHTCTIDRTNNNGSDINKNRTRADSHWNMIGIPSYANYGTTLSKDQAGTQTITWNNNPYTNDLPFLYEWESQDNSYIVQAGTTYPFKSMHAYMVQYHGDIYWSLASATPPAVAPRRYEEAMNPVEYRLELQQNEKKIDQTFVKLSNEENASVGFAFDEDLCKEYNANRANIYTFIEGYIPAAGNTLPMSEQTTVVPVGVKIATNGEYTFAMPEGTEGVGITLVDNETGIRTSLSALDYTVNLEAGTYNERFVLEISPIHHMPTGIDEVSGDRLEVSGARKLMIDGILYIVKDGKMFDARGARVQ